MINEYVSYDTIEQLAHSGNTILCEKIKDCFGADLTSTFLNEMLKFYSEDEITDENIKKFQRSMSQAMNLVGIP